MRCHLRIGGLALLAAVALGGLSNAAWAQRSGRAAVMGRQKVRAKLAAALADGSLSRMEQYSILLQARELLSGRELAGLQRTLDRLATRNRPTSPPQRHVYAGKPTYARQYVHVLPADQQPANGEDSAGGDAAEQDVAEPAAPSESSQPLEENRAESTSYDEPTVEPPPAEPAIDGGEEEDPFIEESAEKEAEEEMLGESVDLLIDEHGTFADSGSFVDTCPTARRNLNDVRLFTTIDAFKGPLDLDNGNGNFGFNFAVNGGFPLAQQRGIGLQAGTSAVLSDFHGTQFTGDTIRSQNFTTVGLFQRSPKIAPKLKWGFAYDWLYDDYYSTLKMSQWRVKLAYDLNECNEVGVWTCIPNGGDSAALGNGSGPFTVDRFKPVAQGDLYLRHWWENGTSTTTWIGIIEEPGDFVFGCDARVPISPRLAFVGNFNYVLPSASGASGQDEEMWNVSMGIEFVPKSRGHRCRDHRFSPLLPLANNGTFAIRRY